MQVKLTQNLGRPATWASGCWERMCDVVAQIRMRKASRQLRVCESVSLGEKRIVAVIQYESQKFLVAGGTGCVNLLARLGEGRDFSELLTEWCERQR